MRLVIYSLDRVDHNGQFHHHSQTREYNPKSGHRYEKQDAPRGRKEALPLQYWSHYIRLEVSSAR